MAYRRTSFAALMVAVLLSACSGGGGSSSAPVPPAPDANSAPDITSPDAVSVSENTSGTVYTAAANDADGDPITFSLTGTDRNDFSFDTQSGAIAFNDAPDFETPADSNTDNVYDLTLSAEDGVAGRTSLDIQITVTDANDARYVDEVFADVNVQRSISFAPGLTLDLFSPAGDTQSIRPIMIAAPGGGFLSQNPDDVEDIARAFARRGYIAATINYTVLSGPPSSQDELAVAAMRATHDMYAAVRFMRADAIGANQYGGQSDAIFVSGESAGGVMSMLAVTLDANDPVSSQAVRDYLDSSGGVYGNIGNNNGVSSIVQGAMPMSGAILDLATVDANALPLYAAHEEFDPVVPCDTGAEGSSFTGLIISGGCDVVSAYQTVGAPAELYLVAGSSNHVRFSASERAEIFDAAAVFFFREVIEN